MRYFLRKTLVALDAVKNNARSQYDDEGTRKKTTTYLCYIHTVRKIKLSWIDFVFRDLPSIFDVHGSHLSIKQ